MASDPLKVWPQERVDRLKSMWDEGLSASQIAAALGGGLSRCAVLGKVHRLGLESRWTEPSERPPRARNPVRAPVRAIDRFHDTETRELAARKAVETVHERGMKKALSRAQWANLNSPVKMRRTRLTHVQPEMTKNQLRAMLTQAVQNTAALSEDAA
jgi:hypothetical protein